MIDQLLVISSGTISCKSLCHALQRFSLQQQLVIMLAQMKDLQYVLFVSPLRLLLE